MKKKSVSKIFLLFVFFQVLYSQPKFRLNLPFWNFNEVYQGEELQQNVVIKNLGDETLVVDIKTSCECINLNIYKLTILPLQEKQIRIKIDTKKYSGKITEYVFFNTNDPKVRYLRWIIEGKVISKEETKYKKELILTTTTTIIPVKLFFTSGCYICKKLKTKFFPALERKFNVKIQVEEYPLELIENYELFISLENQLQDINNKLPAVVVGDKILGGENEIRKYIETLVQGVIQEKFVSLDHIKNVNFILRRVKMLNIATVILAGLVDGVNPCAFATVVFLIAYMSMITKRSTKEIFFTGMFFIIGVFFTYLFVGFILKNIFIINIKNFFGKILYTLLGLTTLILAGLNFIDIIAIKKIESGQEAKVLTQLPSSLRMKIYDFVDRNIKNKRLIPFGFLLGIVISSIEFFCTGQIYLPTIMYMLAYPELKVRGVLYLVIYCFMFILPLLFVFLSILFGLKSETIENIVRKYVKTVKFATGVVFLILSAWMFSVVF
ncbi:MAG: DUF1573 domain-containing protein [Endomicrobia bacterium]|nr:DUF1573 domain-containing protein [Endomicrobiia bacterium]